MALSQTPGTTLVLTAPTGGVVRGRVYLLGVISGVAKDSVAAGWDCPFVVSGVHRFPKAAVAFTQGELAYWDSTGNEVNKSGAGRFPFGAVVRAVEDVDPVCHVSLFHQATATVTA